MKDLPARAFRGTPREDARLKVLRDAKILDTNQDETLDRLTEEARDKFGVEIALISLIDEDRQWFKSCFGFDRRETPIDVSFCVHAVAQGEMVVVEDAREDPRFAENPLVTGPPHLRFYAGAPLTTPSGVAFGTLCIIDYEPRTFGAGKREVLERLANLVVQLPGNIAALNLLRIEQALGEHLQTGAPGAHLGKQPGILNGNPHLLPQDREEISLIFLKQGWRVAEEINNTLNFPACHQRNTHVTLPAGPVSIQANGQKEINLAEICLDADLFAPNHPLVVG